MVALPRVVLGLQPGGGISVLKAQSYVDECRSRKKHEIICYECALPVEYTDVTQAAYARALAVLEKYSDAQVGIGLHSNKVGFPTKDGKRLPVRMVGAALVARNDRLPPIILATSDTTHESAADLVKKAVAQWHERTGSLRGAGPLINKVSRTATNL